MRIGSADAEWTREPFQDHPVWVDATAPTTFLGDINMDIDPFPLDLVAGEEGIWWSPVKVLSLVAQDFGVGVAETQMRFGEGDRWHPATCFTLVPRVRTLVEWFSRDHLGHTEPTHRLTLLFDPSKDVTPPMTSIIPSQPEILDPDGNPEQLWVNSTSWLTLQAEEPQTEGQASGVNRIRYGFDGSVAQNVYVGPLSMKGLAGGQHTLVYQAVDRAGNVEPLQTLPFFVVVEPFRAREPHQR